MLTIEANAAYIFPAYTGDRRGRHLDGVFNVVTMAVGDHVVQAFLEVPGSVDGDGVQGTPHRSALEAVQSLLRATERRVASERWRREAASERREREAARERREREAAAEEAERRRRRGRNDWYR